MEKRLAFIFALGAALSFAFSNFLIAYSSKLRPSLSVMYPSWIVYVAFSLVFHLVTNMHKRYQDD